MNKQEARRIAENKLLTYKNVPYPELRALAEKGFSEIIEKIGKSGRRYQLEVEVQFVDKENGDLKVSVNVDDGGLRAFVPVCQDLVIHSDGTLSG